MAEGVRRRRPERHAAVHHERGVRREPRAARRRHGRVDGRPDAHHARQRRAEEGAPAAILSGATHWCQGFSEPGSGSDLASLQTRAVRDGDDFVINGQKIWTTGAHLANWMFMLARTDPEAPKHRGISYFLVDMKSPGVEVRPLINMANQEMFNEVFFEDVRVPAKNVVGELNRGWYVGTTTLDFERSSIGSAVGLKHTLNELVKFARANATSGVSRTGNLASVKAELADRYIETLVARMMSYRVVTMQAKGLIPNHEASMTKLFASELSQRIARTGIKVLGLYGQLYGPGRADEGPVREHVHDVALVDDRRRHVGDPAQHHRHARPRRCRATNIGETSTRAYWRSVERPATSHQSQGDQTDGLYGYARRGSIQERGTDFILAEAPKPKPGESSQEAMVAGYAANQGWFKKLGEKGWIAPAWPKEYGGASMTTVQQFIFNEEMALMKAPRPMHMIIGLGMAGPTLIVHGTEDQRKKYLPGMLKGEDIWCQGYSEPEAGSDLASLQDARRP